MVASGGEAVKLRDKVALLTGTSPNICGGIALGMAEAGARVVCVDVQPDNAHRCADDIRKRGGEAVDVVCDVTDEAQVQAAVVRAGEAFGGIDILVNGAVIFNQKGVLDMPLVEWTRQITIILTGAFLCTKHVAQSMIDRGRGGTIINIISTAGHQGEPWNIGYCTGKSGLLNFTRSAAMELAEFGIRVNSLTPTATDTAEGMARAGEWGVPFRRPTNPSPRRRGFLGPGVPGVALGRLPSPADYAKAAVFLASDEAAMITGADLKVDAGALARYWRWDPSIPPS
jgi:NAD(P)-dependent dehydrogenase (short-subunit alcohol dehydrogenase family)